LDSDADVDLVPCSILAIGELVVQITETGLNV
jgi:hypothetical protein